MFDGKNMEKTRATWLFGASLEHPQLSFAYSVHRRMESEWHWKTTAVEVPHKVSLLQIRLLWTLRLLGGSL